jgi:diacylglycerol kinase family enzyme
MVVVGTPPDRTRWTTPAPSLRVEVDGRARHEGPATSVVVATGQHLRGLDLVPRGHPGDGRAEVQVYALDRGARSELRRRLATGVHLPHPDVTQAAGRRTVIVALGKPARLEVDGVEVPAASRLVVEVVPEAYAVVV